MVSKYRSKLAMDIAQYEVQLRTGTLLAIDPSSGSAGSLPGYALFKQGQLVDAGVIGIPRGTRQIANRLWQLREALSTEFQKPDILAVEWIAPVIPTAKGTYLHKSAAALIKSVGAILSTWDVPVIEPSPAAWHSMVPKDYQKTDVKDAVAVGWCALVTLARVLGQEDPPMPDILRGLPLTGDATNESTT